MQTKLSEELVGANNLSTIDLLSWSFANLILAARSADSGGKIPRPGSVDYTSRAPEEGAMRQVYERAVASQLSQLVTRRRRKRHGVREVLSSKEKSAASGFSTLWARCNAVPQPSVADYLDVNAELGYTTVVEGVEEFLYQKEMQVRA
jgi:hypothetical protein